MNSKGRAGRSPDRWEVGVGERGVKDGTPVSGSSNRKEGAGKEWGRSLLGGVGGNQDSAWDLVGVTPVPHVE